MAPLFALSVDRRYFCSKLSLMARTQRLMAQQASLLYIAFNKTAQKRAKWIIYFIITLKKKFSLNVNSQSSGTLSVRLTQKLALYK